LHGRRDRRAHGLSERAGDFSPGRALAQHHTRDRDRDDDQWSDREQRVIRERRGHEIAPILREAVERLAGDRPRRSQEAESMCPESLGVMMLCHGDAASSAECVSSSRDLGTLQRVAGVSRSDVQTI
jgi:hypothetical protein